MARKISFSPPDISELEINEVVDAMKSGWITTGQRTKQLEKNLAEYLGTSKVAVLNSWTAAAEMTLRVLGVGPGDEVIVPAYTYTASASIVTHVGAKIVMIDVKPDTFELDYDAIAGAITEKTKVIIPVDLGGRMCDYEKIYAAVESKKDLFKAGNDIQERYNRVIIMSDSAHALGASYKGILSGHWADFTLFSFHAVKNLTTGEGGAVTWRGRPGLDNDWLYKQFMLFSLHGQNKDAFHKNCLGNWEYDIVFPGYKCNMTDTLAAIGLKQLERYPSLLERRKEIIERYDEAFLPYGIHRLVHFDDRVTSSGHLYLARIPGIDVSSRNEIFSQMAENGVACNVHYKPLPMMSAYKNLGFDIANYPNAYAQYQNEITLPLHTSLTDDDVDYVVTQFKKQLERVRKSYKGECYAVAHMGGTSR